MALHGQRRIGKVFEDKLTEYFGMSENEKNYFRNLIRIDEARGDPHILEMRSNEYRRKFKPEVDRFSIGASDPHAQLLQELEFCPMAWTHYEDLHGRSTARLWKK